ncbi:MAG: hypothetical protein RDU20_14355 [Desulfomonilaceae bacterium]|nr:hypothetical protein [Desulfomonilaceae bacterium]
MNESAVGESRSPSKTISIDEVLRDLRAGMRSKSFLEKYGISMPEFEGILKSLIRKGLFTKDEFRAWKARRPVRAAASESQPRPDHLGSRAPQKEHGNVETFVIQDPEKNNSWALQLFSTERERMAGAQFKVNLHGKKYAFVVEKLLFRGAVKMLESEAARPQGSQKKREEAMEFISRHGWAAYLEQRAFAANFDADNMRISGKARLVLLHCRNETFLAALHTPAPAINLYVGGSLDNIRRRLAKSVDTSDLQGI